VLQTTRWAILPAWEDCVPLACGSTFGGTFICVWLQDEEVRQMARAQFSALCSKLDSLSHLHLT
jgi:hypothetical protein